MSLERSHDAQTLALSSPSEAAFSVVRMECFTPDRVKTYLTTQGTPEDDAITTADRLQGFLENPIMQKYFAQYWQHETRSEWTGRTVQKALWETTVHTLDTIKAFAEEFLYDGSYAEEFPDMDGDQVQAVMNQATLAGTIFRNTVDEPIFDEVRDYLQRHSAT